MPRFVSRVQMIQRGLAMRCPNCGQRTLFVPGRYFEVAAICTSCGMRRDKDDAAFLGSTAINYGMSVFGLILSGVVVAYFSGASLSIIVAIAAAAALTVPLAFYRPAKSWWFMTYYLVLPSHLPANWTASTASELPPDE